MARAHFVKKAREDYPDAGIKKGDSYYWWAFQYGPMVRSKTAPKPSQLTQSEFLSTVYDINERLESLSAETAEGLESEVMCICDDIENLKGETEDKLGNMPEQLQQAQTGEMLQGRIDALDEMISNLQSVSYDDVPESLQGETKVAETLEEAKGAMSEDEWKALTEDARKEAICDAIDTRETEIADALQVIIDEISGYAYEGE